MIFFYQRFINLNYRVENSHVSLTILEVKGYEDLSEVWYAEAGF